MRYFTPTGWGIVAALVLALVSLGYCAVTAPGREARKVDAAVAAANARTQRTDTVARETAADERLSDALSTAATKEDLTDAIQSLPDARPSDRRIALACERLRRQGTDPAAVPACRRPEGPAQARPGP